MFAPLGLSFSLLLLRVGLSVSQGICSVQTGVSFTAYGFPDAPGLTAYGCPGGQHDHTAGGPTPLGDGSHDRPYTAAAAQGSKLFTPCSLVYIPYLQKYFRIVDVCNGCDPEKHIDLYIIQANADIGQLSCELAFGGFGGTGHSVITNPGPGLTVNTQPLFEGSTCYNDPSSGRVFPNEDTSACGGSPSNPHPTTGGVHPGIPSVSPISGAPTYVPQPTYILPTASAPIHTSPPQTSQHCWISHGEKKCSPPGPPVKRDLVGRAAGKRKIRGNNMQNLEYY